MSHYCHGYRYIATASLNGYLCVCLCSNGFFFPAGAAVNGPGAKVNSGKRGTGENCTGQGE